MESGHLLEQRPGGQHKESSHLLEQRPGGQQNESGKGVTAQVLILGRPLWGTGCGRHSGWEAENGKQWKGGTGVRHRRGPSKGKGCRWAREE